MVRTLHLPALRAGNQVKRLNSVVSATPVPARFGNSSLRYSTHDINLISLIVSSFRPVNMQKISDNRRRATTIARNNYSFVPTCVKLLSRQLRRLPPVCFHLHLVQSIAHY